MKFQFNQSEKSYKNSSISKQNSSPHKASLKWTATGDENVIFIHTRSKFDARIVRQSGQFVPHIGSETIGEHLLCTQVGWPRSLATWYHHQDILHLREFAMRHDLGGEIVTLWWKKMEVLCSVNGLQGINTVAQQGFLTDQVHEILWSSQAEAYVPEDSWQVLAAMSFVI